MSGLDKQTTERMREAFKVEVDDQTKRIHQATISESLSDYAPDSVPSRRAVLRPMWWRMRVRALITALVVVLPVGTAIAAENTVPGDFLYSVKTASEPIRAMFDSDVAARHRVNELEHLMDHPDRIDRLSDAVADAEAAVTDLPMNHPLRGQLSTLTDMAMDTMQSGNGQMGGTQHNDPMQDSPSDSPMNDEQMNDEQMSDMPENDSSEFDSSTDKDRSGGNKSESNDTGQTNTDANTGGTSDMGSGSVSESDMDQGDSGSTSHNHDNDSSGSDGPSWTSDQRTDG